MEKVEKRLQTFAGYSPNYWNNCPLCREQAWNEGVLFDEQKGYNCI